MLTPTPCQSYPLEASLITMVASVLNTVTYWPLYALNGYLQMFESLFGIDPSAPPPSFSGMVAGSTALAKEVGATPQGHAAIKAASDAANAAASAAEAASKKADAALARANLLLKQAKNSPQAQQLAKRAQQVSAAAKSAALMLRDSANQVGAFIL